MDYLEFGFLRLSGIVNPVPGEMFNVSITRRKQSMYAVMVFRLIDNHFNRPTWTDWTVKDSIVEAVQLASTTTDPAIVVPKDNRRFFPNLTKILFGNPQSHQVV